MHKVFGSCVGKVTPPKYYIYVILSTFCGEKNVTGNYKVVGNLDMDKKRFDAFLWIKFRCISLSSDLEYSIENGHSVHCLLFRLN